MRYWSLTTGLWTDEINAGDKWKGCFRGAASGRVIVVTSRYKKDVVREMSIVSDVIYKVKKI